MVGNVLMDRLVDHWRGQGLPIAQGVAEDRLRAFESDYALDLPNDLRRYFAKCNGMVQRGGADVDREGFAFWPIERVRPLEQVCAESSVEIPEVEGAERYFVFADYLQWSWAYAIRLGTRENTVIFVGTRRPDVVAHSFSEFVEKYLGDDAALYPAQ